METTLIQLRTDLTWASLHTQDACRIPLTVVAVGMLGITLRQNVNGRPHTMWLVRVNYAILAQFAVALVVWLVIAATSDRNVYYFIFNFLLITWTWLTLLALASRMPRVRRYAGAAAKPRPPR